MNAHNERLNRTIPEEFVEYHLDDLLDDTALFNYKLMDYLVWFNAQRPHWALHLQSPLQFLMVNPHQQGNMYWPNTVTCSDFLQHA